MTSQGRSAPAMSLATRRARGVLVAVVAVFIASFAHSAAGHHPPLFLTLLAVVLSLPVCVAMAGVRLSRWRIAVGVLVAQGLLHLLFSPFGGHGGGEFEVTESTVPGHGHQHHGAGAIELPDVAVVGGHGGSGGPSMVLAHLIAAAVTFLFLCHAEAVHEALRHIITLRPVVLLVIDGPVLLVPERARPTGPVVVRPGVRSATWLGCGPRTLRGPPTLAA